MKLTYLFVPIVIMLILPSTAAVAEPLVGTFGADTIANYSALTAKPALDRFTGRTITVEVTGYNLVPGQTDNTPCRGASGEDLCQPSMRNTIATNALPFGTQVIIPSIDPYMVWVVRDRMNARYTDNIDVLVPGTDTQAHADALKIGRRDRKVIVLD